VAGFNPCVEQQLEDAELCCLVETYPAKHEDLDDYLRTLKIAYLYGKTITLSNTHWPETNAKMLKNRRIGLSQSGVIQAFNKFGRRRVYEMCDKAYDYVKQLDEEYSNWLCIPKSVRMTSIKPSGTVSLLNGSTPGIHHPESEYYIRRIRFSKTSNLVDKLRDSGYKVEDDKYTPNTAVVEFPVHEPYFNKGKKDVSIWEQLETAAQYQYYWADNSVSITVTFRPDEAKHIKTALELYETRLKAVSFLKYEETGYEQAPYEAISKKQFEKMSSGITPFQRVAHDEGGTGSKFCTNDTCVL
jgi:adenosylcobalamin-dependent ribonucleoside-triphosphate reductase